MIDLTLERATLSTLLREEGDDAWSRLHADGWTDLVPENGRWDNADVAAAVAGIAAASGCEYGAGAHLAAAATLATCGDSRAGAARLGVVPRLWPVAGELWGRLWSGPSPEVAVAVTPTGQIGVIDSTDIVPTADPLIPLRQVAVTRVNIAPGALTLLDPDPHHDARVAWMLAVEALSAVADATARTLAYARQREAFGGPLTAQQVVRHRLVDMQIAVLMGEALLGRAAREWVEGHEPVSSWAALTLAATRGVWVAEQAIQLHGGIGYTWELGLGRAVALAQRARVFDSGRGAAAQRSALLAARPSGLADWSLEFRL